MISFMVYAMGILFVCCGLYLIACGLKKYYAGGGEDG